MTWQEEAREHEFTDDTTQDTYGRDIELVGCLCGAWQWDSNDHECHERWWDHVLDALAPVVEAEVARAKVEALREAHVAFGDNGVPGWRVYSALLDRADAIERGER